MFLLHGMLLAAVLLTAPSAFAEITSYHIPHPLAWMYTPPVGESPGWSSRQWANLDFSQANIWNMESTMTDRRTGDEYTYKADYEQTTAVLDAGFALSKRWAFAVEIPYANHNGGFLDDFIDQFHQSIRTDRFLRQYNSKFANSFVLEKNGVDLLTTDRSQGVGNIKTKLKWWFWQLRSRTAGACECGMSVSAHAKFPLQRADHGLSSGRHDYTLMTSIGLPLWASGGAWFTAAITKLGGNNLFSGWPMREWQQMYELYLDIGLTKNLGLVGQARLESPLFEQKYLSFNYSYTDPRLRAQERIASGWNAMTEWRGSQTLGLRWRWGKGSHVNFMIIEDWGLGDRDHIGAWNYVNNAPDVGFVNQWHFVF